MLARAKGGNERKFTKKNSSKKINSRENEKASVNERRQQQFQKQK